MNWVDVPSLPFPQKMTTQQIADRLAGYCRQGKWEPAQRELYAQNAVSLEAQASPLFAQETRGLAAIVEKGKKFDAMIETLHGITVSDPLVAKDSFACVMTIDATMRGRGRAQMTELCVYEVNEGKIVVERFHP
jgi:hypothetical protein